MSDDANRMSQGPDEGSLPGALQQRFRDLAHRPDLLDGNDDAAMRAAIHEHFDLVQRHRRGYRRMALLWTAAAVVALAGAVVIRVRAPQQSRSIRPNIATTAPQGDMDRNGVVDILDALRLARDIDAGRSGGDADMNNDGVVDGRDVDVIAMRAVALAGDAG